MRDVRRGIHETRGNIFADLGLPEAENHYLKAQIVAELYRLSTERKLTQVKTGALLGISQPEALGCSKAISGNTWGKRKDPKYG